MKKTWIFFAAFLLAGVFAIPAFAGPFTDVPTDHWAYEAIEKITPEFITGYPDGTFKGNRTLTRYEMAMIIARIYDKLESIQPGSPESKGISEQDLQEYKDLIDNLMKEFEAELAMIKGDVSKANSRLDDVENRLSALERVRRSIEMSGMMRVRVESIITDIRKGETGGTHVGEYYNGFSNVIDAKISGLNAGSRSGLITPIIGGFGTTPGEGISDPELEQLILIALDAKPADWLDVYVDFLQIASYLDSPIGADFPPNQALVIDQALMDADLFKLLGYQAGDVFNRFHMVFGRLYGRFGEYGLAFDNYFETRPGFFWDLGGDRLDLQLLLAQNARNGGMEGLGVFRAAYGFGDSRSTRLERNYFAKVGVNLLISGVGDENGRGIDLNTEVLPNDWFNLLRAEYLFMNQDQAGLDVTDWYGDKFATNYVVGLDVFNDGNLKANVAYANIGLPPGFSGIDNNPFEEYDAMWNGIGQNFNYGYESGINMFPANFKGLGVDVEYTWFEKFYTHLAVYDGKTQDEFNLPVVIRLNLRYPLSESSDIALEYIHAGINYDTIAKLRGEFLVRF